MLSTVLAKTVFEKRWSTFIWFLAIAGTTFFIGMLFPTFRDTLGTSLQNVPESLESLLGNAETYTTLGGYVDVQVINQMIFFTIIMAVISGASLIAGEENSGILQTLLSHPVRRSTVYLHKAAALALLTLLVSSGIFFGIWLSGIILSESMDWTRLAMATLMTWLITLFFGVLAYSIGAINGRKGLAGVVAGGYAFITYIITNMAGSVSSLEKVDYASPFHYFNSPSVIKTGLDFGNAAVLFAAITLLLAVGWYLFQRRDIQLK
jgi:ABC-2 type transport system permease protein